MVPRETAAVVRGMAVVVRARVGIADGQQEKQVVAAATEAEEKEGGLDETATEVAAAVEAVAPMAMTAMAAVETAVAVEAAAAVVVVTATETVRAVEAEALRSALVAEPDGGWLAVVPMAMVTVALVMEVLVRALEAGR